MRLTSLSAPRLAKALARFGALTGGAITIDELRCVLERRGMSERDLHKLFWKMIYVLEPPACGMSHCDHFGGGGAPMNCRLERIPGRCPILKQYKLRQKKRAGAAAPKEAA